MRYVTRDVASIPQNSRPDVADRLAELISQASPMAYRDKLVVYTEAKREISRLCGWDSSPDLRDEELYARSMARFVREAGL